MHLSSSSASAATVYNSGDLTEVIIDMYSDDIGIGGLVLAIGYTCRHRSTYGPQDD